MNREWMEQKLTEYRDLFNAYLRGGRTAGGYLPDDGRRADLRRREPTVKEILKRLDPDLADFNIESRGGEKQARDAADRGLGILAECDEWEANLAPEGPALSAGQFHPWVWEAARTLWESEHYRLGVQAAATAINAHTQTKLSRRDVSDDKLMQEAFSTSPPEPGKKRLRCPGAETGCSTLKWPHRTPLIWPHPGSAAAGL